jgi:hypothetical protein
MTMQLLFGTSVAFGFVVWPWQLVQKTLDQLGNRAEGEC